MPRRRAGQGKEGFGAAHELLGQGRVSVVALFATARAGLPTVSAAASHARVRGSYLGAAARSADDKPPPPREMAAAAGPISVR